MDSYKLSKIHIYHRQQSKARSTTTIEGLDDDLDLEKICKYMRKAFSCNGTVLEGKVIHLQGDQRDTICEWLVKEEVLTEKEAKERLVLHGS